MEEKKKCPRPEGTKSREGRTESELIRGCIGGERFLIWFVQRKRGEITVVKRSKYKRHALYGFPPNRYVRCVRANWHENWAQFSTLPPLAKRGIGKEWKRNGKLRKGGRFVFQRLLSHWPLSRKRESPKLFSRFSPRLFYSFFSSPPLGKDAESPSNGALVPEKVRRVVAIYFFPEQKRQER